jgi:hypothetical protein
MVEAADLICLKIKSLHSVVVVEVAVALAVVAVVSVVTVEVVVAEVASVAVEEVAAALVDPLRQWSMKTKVTSLHSKAKRPLSEFDAEKDTIMSH